MNQIDLITPLSLKTSFRFPLQSAESRREVMIGGLLLLIPVVGWLLNMGHRIEMVHNMMHGNPAWPAWTNYRRLFKNGCITFLGMLYYYVPAILLGAVYFRSGVAIAGILSIATFLMATVAIPGYMSHYCVSFDTREIFNPFVALSRVFESGVSYWRAWLIALSALAISFSGLLFFGIGFLFTSVWFWQVAGFCFATTMARRYALSDKTK